MADDVTPNVDLDVDKTTATVGDTITVTVTKSDLNVLGFGIYLEFDGARLECTNIYGADGDEVYFGMYKNNPRDPWDDASTLDTVDTTNSDSIFSFGMPNGAAAVQYKAGTIATLKFKAIADGEATFTLNQQASGEDNFKGVADTKTVVISSGHTCSDGTSVAGKEATCTEDGWESYYQCSCGNLFEDEDCTAAITDLEAWKTGDGKVAASHDFSEKIEDDAHKVDGADCQTSIEYCYDCKNCDEMGSETWTSTTPGSHIMSTEWTSKDGKHYHECTVSGCDYTEDEADCSGGTATCKDLAVCSVCEKEYGDFGRHDYGAANDWDIREADGHARKCANCDTIEDGGLIAHTPNISAPTEYEDQVCTECGYIIAEATGHNHALHLTEVPAVSADCKLEKNGNKRYYICDGDSEFDCGKLFEDAEAKIPTDEASVVIPFAHDWADADCETPKTCNVCRKTDGEENGHDFTEQIKDSEHRVPGTGTNCQNPYKYYYDCTRCAEISGTDTWTGDPGNHDMSDEWTSKDGKHYHECTVTGCTHIADEANCSGAEATCTTAQTCTVCNTEMAEKLGHDFAEQVADAAHQVTGTGTNCQNPFQYYYDCTRCDEKSPDKTWTGDAGDHNMSDEWSFANDKHYHKCTVTGCTHIADEAPCSGGTATCEKLAVCDVCKNAYGKLADHTYDAEATCKTAKPCGVCGVDVVNPDNHEGGTELRLAKEATEQATGYTGDLHCLGCDALLEKGKVIPRIEREYDDDDEDDEPVREYRVSISNHSEGKVSSNLSSEECYRPEQQG